MGSGGKRGRLEKDERERAKQKRRKKVAEERGRERQGTNYGPREGKDRTGKKKEQDEMVRKTKELEGRVFGEGKSWRARVRDSERFNISFCVALGL